MTKCSYIEKYLIDYIFGELPEDLEKEVNEHLQICQTCNMELDEMLNTIDLLKALKQEETPRILYFKQPNSLFSKIAQFKTLLAVAASVLIILNAFIIFKLYPSNSQLQNALHNRQQQTQSLNPEINKLIEDALEKYKNEQAEFLNIKMKELENRLLQQQNQQLIVFKNAVDKNTRSMMDDYFKVHEQNRIDDLRNVAETIMQLQQQNEYERAKTYQILNYLVNASDKKNKY
jgi:hypothetical protein